MNFLSSFFRPSIRIEGIQGKCTILEENISCENLRTRGNCARLKCHMHKDSRRNTEYLYPMENLNSLNGTNANSRTMASATAIRWGGEDVSPNALQNATKSEKHVVATNAPPNNTPILSRVK